MGHNLTFAFTSIGISMKTEAESKPGMHPRRGAGDAQRRNKVIAGKEYTGLRGHFVQIQGAITGA